MNPSNLPPGVTDDGSVHLDGCDFKDSAPPMDYCVECSMERANRRIAAQKAEMDGSDRAFRANLAEANDRIACASMCIDCDDDEEPPTSERIVEAIMELEGAVRALQKAMVDS